MQKGEGRAKGTDKKTERRQTKGVNSEKDRATEI